MKILHLDIETAPHKVYAWGLWDQNIGTHKIIEAGYTLCFSAKWHGKKDLYFSGLNTDTNEQMMKKAHALLEEADAVSHYNGTRFDIPTLNKEFILLGMEPPSGYKEIDLLRVARQRFKFPSNKLDYVAQVLGLGGKHKHMGMDLWKGCMANDPACWKIMERYNKQDVRLLEKVYKKLLPWIKTHPNYGLYVDSDRPVCKNCGKSKVIKKGYEFTQVGKYQRYKCASCSTPMRGATLMNTLEDRKKLLR